MKPRWKTYKALLVYWNMRLNKSSERWFGPFVHSELLAQKGMKMPIKEKPVHMRRKSREYHALGSIRRSISWSNLEWARDLEGKVVTSNLKFNPGAIACVIYARTYNMLVRIVRKIHMLKIASPSSSDIAWFRDPTSWRTESINQSNYPGILPLYENRNVI